jgi:hypothetical protein
MIEPGPWGFSLTDRNIARGARRGVAERSGVALQSCAGVSALGVLLVVLSLLIGFSPSRRYDANDLAPQTTVNSRPLAIPMIMKRSSP